jgi:hypothetical protein
LLCRLLDELDAPKREVLMLAELEDMTVPEIAEAVGIPLNTATSRLRVARQRFNQLFSRHVAVLAARDEDAGLLYPSLRRPPRHADSSRTSSPKTPSRKVIHVPA